MARGLTQDKVLERFKAKWPDWRKKYDYSSVVYINQNRSVQIQCLKHSCAFEQKPCDHWLGKQGCPECKKESKRALYASNKDEFVSRARKIHGDKYSYEK